MKGDGNLKYSIKNPLEPMTFDEYLKVVLFKEAPHLYKPSTGGGAGSSSGTGHSAYKKRSEMSAAEKTNYIAQHGQEKFKQLPA